MDITKALEERVASATTEQVDVSLIDPSRYQARRNFDSVALASLAENIRQQTLLHPILLRRVGHRFELISGERRLRAIRDVLKQFQIEARIIGCTDQEASDRCAIANFQNETLLISEQARQVKIMQDSGRFIVDIAFLLNLTEKKVSELLTVADLPEPVQEMLDDQRIKMNAVPILNNIQGAVKQVQAAKLASDGRLTAPELKGRTQHYPKRPPSPAMVRSRTVVSHEQPLSIESINQRVITMRLDLSGWELSPDQLLSQPARVLSSNISALIQRLQELQRQLPK